MKVRGKKLLAAMLSLAMVLSMFVVPAAAADLTGEIGDKWMFIGTSEYSGQSSYNGLVFSQALNKNGDQYGMDMKAATITIPVKGPCDIEVVANYSWNLTLGDKTETGAINNQEGTAMVFPYTGGEGTVDLVANAQTYIVSIEIKAHSTDPVLTLDKSSVVVKMGGTSAVTATVENATDPEITATSASEAVARATVGDGGAITITPVTAGKTTVTVGVTGTELTKTIAVRVLPAEVGTVTANKTYNFQNVNSSETAQDNYYAEGLEWSGPKLDNSHGPYGGSVTLTVHIPENKKTTLTVVTCGYSASGHTMTSNGSAVEGGTPDADDGNGNGQKFVVADATGTVTLAFSGGTVYVHSLAVGAFTSTTEPEPEPEPGNGKVDVYDFGAEALDTAKFNNMLTVDAINAWYPGVAAGTSSTALPASVTTGKFTYESDKTNTRLRTTNGALTHYDTTNNRCDLAAGQDPYDSARTSYTGVICSNGGTITLKLTTGAGDKLTYIMGSNGGTEYTTTFTGADGSEKTAVVPAAHAAVTFYAPKTGTQSLFSGVDSGNRPAVARIYVEQPTAVTVSGSLTIDSSLADPTGLKLVFTNDDSGLATEATITGNTYTVSLGNYQAGATYTVTAEGITGGTIMAGKALALTGETGETASHNVTVGQVSLVDVSGDITGLSADALGRLKLTLTPPEGNIYIPEVTLAAGAWSAQLQSGVEYTVNVENVNDYTLDTTKVKYSADTTDADIAFTAKPTYTVTIVPTGLTLDELADATFTFTNVKETYEAANGKPASYVYTFTGANAIALRNGQYSVKVETAKGRQELTADVKVNGAAVNCPIEFDVTAPTEWNFRSGSELMGANGVKIEGSTGTVNGLDIDATSGKFDSTRSDWAQTNAGAKISVPVSAADGETVTLTVNCYNASSFTIGGTANTKTQANEDFTCTVTNGAVEIVCTANSYIGYIKVTVTSSVEFKDTVTVGDGKDCATITEALALVAQMDRPNNERVAIVIDPGDYEEQLEVTVPNVTLKNAKASEAKLELKDEGVGIGDNEVRITHYYGHGYTYYSMTNGHRYNEKVLAVNKANGYPSYINKGSGSTDNSYWNASVLVKADGFQAEGIIFENSFNQYVSAKAANDVIVPQSGAAKEPAGAPRATLAQGSTAVQDKTYVERAAALVITNNVSNVFFDKCAFIGRQDTLAGGQGSTVAFYNCDVYGGTDFIMDDMKAVFAKCNLVMNTSENKNDVAYITAAKSTGGYLMYNCSVISTVPGVNTASKLPSKPGTFGRPWEANCEVVFYETIVDTTTTKADGTQGTEEVSLIQPIGWTEGLNGGGNFQRCVEYHTHEVVDNSASRHANANVFTEPKRADGSAIDYTTWLGGWNPFEGKDMAVLGCPDTSRTVTFNVSSGASVTDLAADGAPQELDSKNKLVALKEAVITFKIGLTEGYTLNSVTGATWDDDSVYTVTADTVVISASRPSSGGDMLPTGPVGGNKGETVTNPDGSKTTTTTDKKGNTIVTTVAPDGSKVETVTTKAGDKTVTVTDAKGEVQVKIELPATISAPKTKFVDVPEGHWAEKAIDDMAGLNLVKGVSDDTFDMVSPITRASVATILFRLSNGAAGKTSSFTDVPAGEWYADAVAWAAGAGVVNGYSETIFAPNESITREQFAVMLYRFAKLIGVDTAASGDMSQFSDAASVSQWAAEAMTWCVGKGILNGTNDPVQGIALSPAKTASRAECAVMLGRFIALI